MYCKRNIVMVSNTHCTSITCITIHPALTGCAFWMTLLLFLLLFYSCPSCNWKFTIICGADITRLGYFYTQQYEKGQKVVWPEVESMWTGVTTPKSPLPVGDQSPSNTLLLGTKGVPAKWHLIPSTVQWLYQGARVWLTSHTHTHTHTDRPL